eukprot:12080432-Heterocapsa_arctica.AAC.1
MVQQWTHSQWLRSTPSETNALKRFGPITMSPAEPLVCCSLAKVKLSRKSTSSRKAWSTGSGKLKRFAP